MKWLREKTGMGFKEALDYGLVLLFVTSSAFTIVYSFVLMVITFGDTPSEEVSPLFSGETPKWILGSMIVIGLAFYGWMHFLDWRKKTKATCPN